MFRQRAQQIGVLVAMKEIPSYLRSVPGRRRPVVLVAFCSNCDARVEAVRGELTTCGRCWHSFVVGEGSAHDHAAT